MERLKSIYLEETKEMQLQQEKEWQECLNKKPRARGLVLLQKEKKNTEYKQYVENNPEKFVKPNTNPGIYQLKSKATGKIYIGQAKNLGTRKQQHFKNLESRRHNNYKLRDHVQIYGVDDLVFSILEECLIKYLDKREDFWLLKTPHEFNISDYANSPMKDKHHSVESKKQTSRAHFKRFEDTEVRKQFCKMMQVRSTSPKGRVFDTNQDRINYHQHVESLKRVEKRLEELQQKKKELNKWILIHTPQGLTQYDQDKTEQKGFFY